MQAIPAQSPDLSDASYLFQRRLIRHVMPTEAQQNPETFYFPGNLIETVRPRQSHTPMNP
jgi:hypothetical protein